MQRALRHAAGHRPGILGALVREAGQAGANLAGHLQEVLAQRVAGEAVPEEQPAQVGMAVEADAEQVEDLALLQVRAVVEAGQRGHGRILAVGGDHLDLDDVVEVQRLEVVDELEVALAVDRGEVAEEDEVGGLVVAQRLDRLGQALGVEEERAVGDAGRALATRVDHLGRRRRIQLRGHLSATPAPGGATRRPAPARGCR